MNLPRIIAPKRYVDERGWFSETFHEQRLHEMGITCRFVQDNQSCSKRPGTLRGLHFQLPPAAQAKLVSVLRGRILDVAVDVRCGSPTYGNHVAIELSPKQEISCTFLWGSLMATSRWISMLSVMYKASTYYAPSLDRGLRWNDPDIAIPWPCKAADIITSKKVRRFLCSRNFPVHSRTMVIRSYP